MTSADATARAVALWEGALEHSDSGRFHDAVLSFEQAKRLLAATAVDSGAAGGGGGGRLSAIVDELVVRVEGELKEHYALLDGNHFLTLGLRREGCSAKAVRKAYRAFVLRYHPDKTVGLCDSSALFRGGQLAYEALSDPERLAAYAPRVLPGDWLRRRAAETRRLAALERRRRWKAESGLGAGRGASPGVGSGASSRAGPGADVPQSAPATSGAGRSDGCPRGAGRSFAAAAGASAAAGVASGAATSAGVAPPFRWLGAEELRSLRAGQLVDALSAAGLLGCVRRGDERADLQAAYLRAAATATSATTSAAAAAAAAAPGPRDARDARDARDRGAARSQGARDRNHGRANPARGRGGVGEAGQAPARQSGAAEAQPAAGTSAVRDAGAGSKGVGASTPSLSSSSSPPPPLSSSSSSSSAPQPFGGRVTLESLRRHKDRMFGSRGHAGPAKGGAGGGDSKTGGAKAGGARAGDVSGGDWGEAKGEAKGVDRREGRSDEGFSSSSSSSSSSSGIEDRDGAGGDLAAEAKDSGRFEPRTPRSEEEVAEAEAAEDRVPVWGRHRVHHGMDEEDDDEEYGEYDGGGSNVNDAFGNGLDFAPAWGRPKGLPGTEIDNEDEDEDDEEDWDFAFDVGALRWGGGGHGGGVDEDDEDDEKDELDAAAVGHHCPAEEKSDEGEMWPSGDDGPATLSQFQARLRRRQPWWDQAHVPMEVAGSAGGVFWGAGRRP